MAEKNELRRMRTLLQKMAEMAQNAELTGSFESGARNYVKRYNAIVEHLEDNDTIPEELFPRLEEDETDIGQLGAEATLLADYLSDLVEDSPKGSTKSEKADLGVLAALAPFLEQGDLSKMVRKHFSWQKEGEVSSQKSDLNTVVALAPFVDRETLTQMVKACLEHQQISDPNMLVALAPHMDRRDFSQLLREHMPNWFGGQAPFRGEDEAKAEGEAGVDAGDRSAQEGSSTKEER